MATGQKKSRLEWDEAAGQLTGQVTHSADTIRHIQLGSRKKRFSITDADWLAAWVEMEVRSVAQDPNQLDKVERLKAKYQAGELSYDGDEQKGEVAKSIIKDLM